MQTPEPPLYNVFAQVYLTRPPTLPHGQWAAIAEHVTRLNRAIETDDRPLCIGSCKELVESVARVILEIRGESVADNDEYDKVLGRAHDRIQYQVGDDISANSHVRAAATNAKKLAGLLRDFRNDQGTGHGRSAVARVEDEVLEACVVGALVWTRWAVRRLEDFISADVQRLVDALAQDMFRRGDLRRRLVAVGLPHLDGADQRRLGTAVGRRIAEGTFVVREDGLEACVYAKDNNAWPLQYRVGLVEALFINEAGQLWVTDSQFGGIHVLTDIQNAYGDMGKAALLHLRAQIDAASWSSGFIERWRQAVAEMTVVEGAFTPEERGTWWAIKDDINRLGTEREQIRGSAGS